MTPMEEKLYSRLRVEREVRFMFRKESGEIRDARGTCNLEYIPRDKHPEKHIPITTSIRYYDWDREAWRSFHLGNLLSVL